MGDSDAMAMYSKGPMDKSLICTSCGKRGHASDKFWGVTGFPKWHYKYKPGQKVVPGKWSGNKSNQVKAANNAQVSEQQTIMMTTQQLDQILKLIPKTGGSSQKESETDEEIDYGFSGMVSSSQEKFTGALEWIIDSGASDHMTSSLENLMNVKRVPSIFTITLPTGATTMITHIGDVVLENGLKLVDVLYVPQFHHNLLSIHKLAQDNNCEVIFHPKSCTIMDSETKDVVGVGEMKRGLYYLNNNKVNVIVKAMSGQRTCEPVIGKFEKKGDDNEYKLWHLRLGHASFSRLKYVDEVKPFLSQHNKQVCVICPLSKMTKLPFIASDSHASAPFNLIHTDIWGPYKVTTKGKFRYFLTIVDDFSRMTWVYLLEKKSNYLDTLIKFEVYIANQFEGKLKIIRSDNALEFSDKACHEHFEKKGMVHQKSCPYTPQQNARVERKHRNILEMARALRFQSGLSLNFWGDCVLTAVYIINRIPSSAINFEVPYEKLTGEKVDYNLLKVFGCLGVAHNSTHVKDKFAPRGIMCVFLGYPNGTKGYRMLNLNTMQTFVTRNVLFYESVMPLSKENDNSQTSSMDNIVPYRNTVGYEDEVQIENLDDNESNVEDADNNLNETNNMEESSQQIKTRMVMKQFLSKWNLEGLLEQQNNPFGSRTL